MDNICKICNEQINDSYHFWRAHKMTEQSYYHKHYPKYDLFSKRLIPFKSKEYYELTDFIDKGNLKKYLESIDKQTGVDYLVKFLIKRKEIKKVNHAPGQFEAMSLKFPSIQFIERFFGYGTYKSICESADLNRVYNYDLTLNINPNKFLTFIADTREQDPLKFTNLQIGKLDFGDYTIENNKNNIFIERKTGSDFIGTMSHGYERFIKEIDRCVQNNSYLVILIEAKYYLLFKHDIMKFNPVNQHSRFSKCSTEFICHRFREIIKNYTNNVQFLAVDGRSESCRVIEKIYRLDSDIRKVDLQYFYDTGKL